MVAFISIIIFFAIISYSLLINSFQQYYHEDIYRVLEDNNDYTQPITDVEEFINNKDVDDRKIETLYWVKVNDALTIKSRGPDSELTEDIKHQIENNIINQKEESKRYVMDVNGRKLFYIITQYNVRYNISYDKILNESIRQKVFPESRTVVRAALRWEPLDDTLEKQLFYQMGIGLLVIILSMLVVLFFLSRHLTRPLIQLSNSVNQISKRKFDTPITINQKDEIGVLASTIEKMRKELLRYDEEQKLKLHSISHELKTPIMIIQSYIDALGKGLYPKGTQESSIVVIDEECRRLQKLVNNILRLQRLDYFDSEIKNKERVNLKEVVEEVVKSMTVKLDNVDIQLRLEDVFILADYKQMKVVVENLYSNQIRYAKTLIKIHLQNNKNGVSLEFYNDGEHLENEEDLFKMFKKGKNGQSGLGLYIVKRLLNIYDGHIIAYNEEVGVTFKIHWNH